MKRRKLGTKEEHISYLEENKTMDRSILAFNLQAMFGLKKKEAASMIREWVYAEECGKKTDEDVETDEEESEDTEDKFKKNQFKKKSVNEKFGLEDYGEFNLTGINSNNRDAKIYTDQMMDFIKQGKRPEDVARTMESLYGREWNKLTAEVFAKIFRRMVGQSLEDAYSHPANRDSNI